MLNPSFTVVEFDVETMLPVNIDTHFFNVTLSNEENKAIWAKLYNFQEEYGIEDLSPLSIEALTQKINTEEESAIKYLSNMQKQAVAPQKNCDAACRLAVYCSVHSTEVFQEDMCNNGGKMPYIKNPFEYITDPWLKRID
jgi:hypothetical protein